MLDLENNFLDIWVKFDNYFRRRNWQDFFVVVFAQQITDLPSISVETRISSENFEIVAGNTSALRLYRPQFPSAIAWKKNRQL